MKKIKVSEVTGPALDWMVAKCEGDVLAALNIQYPQYAAHFPKISPSTDWAQGGPIIERHITKIEDYGDCWGAEGVDAPEHFGPTPLIAAMRCYVASKLGDEVEVPEELV